jgi:hypothetical protein
VTHDSDNDRVHFRAYSFWAPGAPGTGYNVVGDLAGATCLQLVDGPMTSWIVATKDSVAVVADIGATYSKGYFGAMDREVPAQQDFYGELAGQLPTANQIGTTELFFKVGTDFTNIEAGQYLWLVNQSTTSGGANAERVQVDSLDLPNRKINVVDPLGDDYDTNAVVAFDPQPLILWGNSGGDLFGASPYALHSAVAYGGGLSHALARTSEIDLLGLAVFPSTAAGLVPLADNLVYDAGVGQLDLPGKVSRFARAPTGTLVDLDDVTVGTQVYRAFADDTGMFVLRET